MEKVCHSRGVKTIIYSLLGDAYRALISVEVVGSHHKGAS